MKTDITAILTALNDLAFRDASFTDDLIGVERFLRTVGTAELIVTIFSNEKICVTLRDKPAPQPAAILWHIEFRNNIPAYIITAAIEAAITKS